MYNEESPDENAKEEEGKEDKLEVTVKEMRLFYFETEKNKSILWKLKKNKYLIICSFGIVAYYYMILFYSFHPIYESSLNSHISRDSSFVSSSRIVIYFFLYHIVLALFLICLYKISLGNPGHLDKDYNNLYNLKSYYMMYKRYLRKGGTSPNENKQDLSKLTQRDNPMRNLNCFNFKANHIKENICRFCVTIKPERCSHCKTCRKCIRRKDHHCWVLNNCIGYGNYKIFLNLLFYTCLLCWTSSYILTESILLYDILSLVILILIMAICSFILGCVLFYFLCYHLDLLMLGVTQMEETTKLIYRNEEYYNQLSSESKLERLYSVLGPHILMWFIPICNIHYIHFSLF